MKDIIYFPNFVFKYISTETCYSFFLFFFPHYMNILKLFLWLPNSFESSALNLGFQLSQLFATN